MSATSNNAKNRRSTADKAAVAEPAAALEPGPATEELAEDAPASEPTPPEPVALDLDTLNKFDVLDNLAEEDFTFRLGGHVFAMCDPRDINWQDIFQSLRNPAMFMRYAIPKDQQDLFYAQEMPAWQLGVLMERWHKHYNMADPGDIAKLISG